MSGRIKKIFKLPYNLDIRYVVVMLLPYIASYLHKLVVHVHFLGCNLAVLIIFGTCCSEFFLLALDDSLDMFFIQNGKMKCILIFLLNFIFCYATTIHVCT